MDGPWHETAALEVFKASDNKLEAAKAFESVGELRQLKELLPRKDIIYQLRGDMYTRILWRFDVM